MTSIRNAFLATALAVAPFAFAGQVAQASTVTGSLTYSTNATVTGSLTSAGVWELVAKGTFSVTGDLSDDEDPADDWEVTGTIGITGFGSISASSTWGAGPISAMDLVVANLPYSDDLLFTAFANAMTLSASAIPGGAEDSYTFVGGFGLLPAGDKASWKIEPPTITSLAPGNIDVTGDFVFKLSGSNALLTALTVATFLGIDIDSIPDDLAALVIGGLVGDGVPLEMSLTLTPLSNTPHPIPLPAALPLLAGGLGVLGVMGWRRRRA